ncbi:MAG: ABC transporter permease [Firmicutes bacterium]|jgi:peptide/nickel transport system permease protein|uniref:Peptide ABC transporter permease n=1 Tax=Sulfobacillus benefaciens TaxID=453960 RepID=A0A2T2XA09_9FIRM|nr:ABC transporter permease [Bacillota bacterium]PSR31351.1 MAG: peptide ABC transporter permease [Sulfobacillus benefaciens]
MLGNTKFRWGLTIFMLFVLMAILAPVISPYSPTLTSFTPLDPPSLKHLLGTTANGQDVLSQVIWGTRISLGVGVGAGALSIVISIAIGLLAGYKGGLADKILTTVTNIVLVIPGLPLIIVVAAYVRATGPLTIALVIGLTGWAWGARVLRSQSLSLASRDYVTAAKLQGNSDAYIIRQEILPNMISLIVANFVYSVLSAILAEAALEFLGFGNVSDVSWGTMLYWANNGQALLSGAWWWFVPPGLAIAMVGASLALMNYGVDEIANPKLSVHRKRRANKRS